MNLSVIVIILITLIALVAVSVFVLMTGATFGSRKQRQHAAVSESLRSMVMAQRHLQEQQRAGVESKTGKKTNLALVAAAEGELSRKRLTKGSKVTLEKKLRYAHWSISPLQFRGIKVFCMVIAYLPTQHLTVFIQILAPVMTFLMAGAFLDIGVDRRFKLFDEDYPVFLNSVVSLLKTGMQPLSALQAGAEALDEGSLVRAEVHLLIERLQLGLTEEQALGAFGEDIPHPELELFVQSLLLNRKVGGMLSSTLDRLGKQVRKRQEFRKKAVAAVGMERGSIWAIAVIMTLLMFYLFFSSPDLVVGAFEHDVGKKMFQGGIMVIVLGIYWSRRVTRIKI